MNTINIPAGVNAEDMAWHVYMASKHAADAGHDALANERNKLSDDISTLNVTPVADLSAPCDCSERDPNEIAVYLTAEEIEAVQWALKRITFGDLDDDVDTLELHGAMKEIREAALR